MDCRLLKENRQPKLEESRMSYVKARNDVFCNVSMAIPVFTSLLSWCSRLRSMQTLIIYFSSTNSSTNGCGWLLDDSTLGDTCFFAPQWRQKLGFFVRYDQPLNFNNNALVNSLRVLQYLKSDLGSKF